MDPSEEPDTAITLACINVERCKHLPKLLPFLADVRADILCLQELVAGDIASFLRSAGYVHQLFVPMARHSADGSFGIAILSRLPMAATEVLPYAGEGTGHDIFDSSSMHSKLRTARFAVALATFNVQGRPYTIGTTHFPWTPDASAAEFQRIACDAMMKLLGRRELVLCGDFNAPRGGEIFRRLADKWHDNIPPGCVSTLDPRLHRAAPLDLVVDGIFSTSSYRVDDVCLHCGVSDHLAIIARLRAGAGLSDDRLSLSAARHGGCRQPAGALPPQ